MKAFVGVLGFCRVRSLCRVCLAFVRAGTSSRKPSIIHSASSEVTSFMATPLRFIGVPRIVVPCRVRGVARSPWRVEWRPRCVDASPHIDVLDHSPHAPPRKWIKNCIEFDHTTPCRKATSHLKATHRPWRHGESLDGGSFVLVLRRFGTTPSV